MASGSNENGKWQEWQWQCHMEWQEWQWRMAIANGNGICGMAMAMAGMAMVNSRNDNGKWQERQWQWHMEWQEQQMAGMAMAMAY